MEQSQTDLFCSELKLDETAKGHIRSMASWMMIIVTVAVIGYALTILALLMPGMVNETASEGFGSSVVRSSGSPGGVMFNLAVGILINYFLFSFARGSKAALNGMNQAQLASSFRNLKIYFVITSILLIIVAIIFLFAFVALL